MKSCPICLSEYPSFNILSRHMWKEHHEPPPHGTAARYSHNHAPCDCFDCREAHTSLMGAQRKERQEVDPISKILASWSPPPGFSLDWQKDAACRGTDLDLFYARRPSPAVRQMCNSCPVREDCRDWAVEVNEIGYWGGTTEYERRKIRKERKANPKPK